MEVLFYVIIAIIYVIFSVAGGNKKKDEKSAKKPTNQPQIADSEDIKLEDIIKKLTQNAQKSQTPSPTVSYQTESQSLETSPSLEIYPTAKSYESNPYALDNAPYETVDYDEEAILKDKEQAFQDKIKKRQDKLDDSKANKYMVSDTPTKKNIIKKVNPYTKLLQNKESLKQAFIASEIFKTKF
ncbi:MAG: hypothetical protein MUE85_20440 [Microscillaceae bacterium]|jgi:hypothetical protein|nr:hypothetical protein [Microscillaceae bacterium]